MEQLEATPVTAPVPVVLAPRRPLGLRLIIAYKLLKVPAMVGLALALTLAPVRVHSLVADFAEELAGGGALVRRIGEWIHGHVLPALVAAKWIAWLDALATLVEVVLLLMGKAWGEWIVVAGLGALIPAELWSMRKPSVIKLMVLAGNAVIVAYLARRRLRLDRKGHAPS